MHFLVFVPGGGGLEDVGLSDLVSGSAFAHCESGPDGERGTIFTWFPVPASYRPDEQEWVHDGLPGRRYAVGIWKGSPPRPSELQRRKVSAGQAVEFGDGCEWVVPHALSLPRNVVLSEFGDWTLKLDRKLSEWEQQVDEWRDRFMRVGEEGQRPIMWTELADFVLESLRINYRITPAVVSHLGLFRTGVDENLMRAGMAICSLGGAQ